MRTALTMRSTEQMSMWIQRHALIVVCTMSLGVNVVQGERLRAAASLSGARPEIVSELPPLQLTRATGERITFTADDRLPTILYHFSPTCRWCQANWPGVKALRDATRGRYRFIALSSTDVAHETARLQNLDFEVFSGLSDTQRRSAGLGGVPHTIVISTQGKVIANWQGAYTNNIAKQIQAYFDVSLPALRRQGSQTAK